MLSAIYLDILSVLSIYAISFSFAPTVKSMSKEIGAVSQTHKTGSKNGAQTYGQAWRMPSKRLSLGGDPSGQRIE